jgi:hypothetical protein
MKDIHPIFFIKKIAKIFLFISISFVVFSFYSFDAAEDNKELDINNCVPQNVYSLSIPKEIMFANSPISLTRYDMRERFDRELLSFSYMHSTTFLIIKRANLYFPIIEPILKANNIPDDFKYLALIESYFNPRAISSVKAMGIWQFMGPTAEMYGLEVSDQVDERFNIEKETEAACKYFKDAYAKYNDWATVAASYNVGTARISQELEKQKVQSSLNLYLNEETSRYVFRILAAKEIMTSPKKYGYSIKKEDLYHTIRTKTVEVNTSVEDWAEWAKAYDITYSQLKDFNLWIRDSKLENEHCKVYQVKIPYKEDLDFDVEKIIVYDKNWIE